MLRSIPLSALIIVLLASMLVLSEPAANQAMTASQTYTQHQQVRLTSGDSDPPTQECVEMVSLVLGGLAIRAGAAAYTVGSGAVYANAQAVLGNLLGVVSSYKCASYVVPRYIKQVCEQSRQALKYRKTWEAKALVEFATGGRKHSC